MANHAKVSGSKCYLAPLLLEQAEQLAGWMNDPEVTINLGKGIQSSQTPDSERTWIEGFQKSGEPIFGIYDLANHQVIGATGLHNISPINRKGEFGISIGEKSYWGKGYGQEATMLMLDYGFNVLNLHSINLWVFEYNTRGIHCYERCGFKHAGVRRQSHFVAGRMWDVILMDILANEFTGGYVRAMLPAAGA